MDGGMAKPKGEAEEGDDTSYGEGDKFLNSGVLKVRAILIIKRTNSLWFSIKG